MLVERLVHQRIGPEVIEAGDVLEDDRWEIAGEGLDLLDEGPQVHHLHLVLAGKLLDDELGIEVADETVGVVALGDLESLDERTVLRDVIGLDPDAFRMLLERHAARGIFQDAADGGLAGIPPRTAVREEVERPADGLRLIGASHLERAIELAAKEIGDKLFPFADAREELLESTLEGGGDSSHGNIWYNISTLNLQHQAIPINEQNNKQ